MVAPAEEGSKTMGSSSVFGTLPPRRSRERQRLVEHEAHSRWRAGLLVVGVVYILNISLFFGLNYCFYLFVPVTGPQYYFNESFSHLLPFSSFGLHLYALVQNKATNWRKSVP